MWWHCMAVAKMLDLGKSISVWGLVWSCPIPESGQVWTFTILTHFWELYPFLEQ